MGLLLPLLLALIVLARLKRGYWGWDEAGAIAIWAAFTLYFLWDRTRANTVYQADEMGLTHLGWPFGPAHLSWDEIGSYRVHQAWRGFLSRRRGGVVYCHLTYRLYDRQGRRRIGVDLALLEEAGEPLFDLLMRKLTEMLPGEEHSRPELPHLRLRRLREPPANPADRQRDEADIQSR